MTNRTQVIQVLKVNLKESKEICKRSCGPVFESQDIFSHMSKIAFAAQLTK